MKTHQIRGPVLLVVVAALMSIACGGDGGGGSVTGPKAVPGELTATLVTPNADDRAILITITGPGPVSSVAAANDDYVVFSKVSGSKVSVALFGSLTSGTVIRFHVPDVGLVSSYTASLVEVVDPANNVRPQQTGYSVSISK